MIAPEYELYLLERGIAGSIRATNLNDTADAMTAAPFLGPDILADRLREEFSHLHPHNQQKIRTGGIRGENPYIREEFFHALSVAALEAGYALGRKPDIGFDFKAALQNPAKIQVVTSRFPEITATRIVEALKLA